MKKWLFAILLGAALVLAACGGDDNANNNNDGNSEVSTAEAAYKKNCAACHGNDLEGGGGPSLEAVGSDYSAEEIEDIIENGTENGKMKAQKQVSDEDRTEIANWLADKK